MKYSIHNFRSKVRFLFQTPRTHLTFFILNTNKITLKGQRIYKDRPNQEIAAQFT